MTVDAWIDTTFTGYLVMPRRYLSAMNMQPTAKGVGILGNGSPVSFDLWSCLLDWFGQVLLVEVAANDGEYPLLGVPLRMDHTLTINYPASTLHLV